jgi:hypothetical protein
MRTSYPSRIGCGDPACRGRGHRYDFKTERVDQPDHLFADIPPSRDDQGFCHGPGGNHNLRLGFQEPYARVCLLLS